MQVVPQEGCFFKGEEDQGIIIGCTPIPTWVPYGKLENIGALLGVHPIVA